MHIDLPTLIQSIGYLGVWAMVFAESGLLIGFFLPGDSLLFTAGFLASQGLLNPWLLIAGAAVAAVLGDNVGYATGRHLGPRLFQRQDSWLFHKDNLRKAQRFFERHGGKALVLARFVPVVRTFTPITAGMGAMHYPTFLGYNLAGGLLWTVVLTLLGFFLGNAIPNVDRYLLPIVVAIVVVSVAPSALHLWQSKQAHKRALRRRQRLVSRTEAQSASRSKFNSSDSNETIP
ncbi:VTT domain-containing protein [Nodosilinea nodulosa]|uniref:VTT domain-containing protein n=1 Tax=Nodosilinea nodulosa TaxID=416001 RepID=UPI000317934E